MKYKKVNFAVEATHFEQFCLWKENEASVGADNHVEWKEILEARLATIGTIGDLPVCVSLIWVTLDGHLVLFYECTSRANDWDMIEQYIKDNHLNDGYTKTNPMNFHTVIHAIKRSGKVEAPSRREIFIQE